MKIHLPGQASQVFGGCCFRYGPRDSVTVFSHLDECVLFRGCFSVSSCEAKITFSVFTHLLKVWGSSTHFSASCCRLALEQPCCSCHTLSPSATPGCSHVVLHSYLVWSHLTVIPQGLNLSLWVNIIHKELCEPFVGKGSGLHGFATCMHLLLGAS